MAEAANLQYNNKGYINISERASCGRFAELDSNIITSTCYCSLILQPGFLDGVLGHMKNMVKRLKPSELVASLVFDEMAIKKHLDYNKALDAIYGLTPKGQVANQAMVLMARGVASKLEAGYFFLLFHTT